MEKKKMKLGRREVSIPHEIMFEIFSWLPVKSLIRFKCVSRLCNSIVFESYFIDIHRCRSMIRPGGTKFFLHERKGFYAADQQEEDGNISASLIQTERFIELHALADYPMMNCANGLFCVWEPSFVRPAMIFNPSTRKVRFLPDPNKGSYSCNYLLGFEPEEKKYKVVLSELRKGYIKQWVLTLGIDESWREIQNIFPSIPHGNPSVCINGVIYQLVTAPKCAITAFDVKYEKFEIITLWNESHWVHYYELIEVKGKLAVVDYRWDNRYFDLWILEEAPKREWQKQIIQFPSIWNYKIYGPISSCTSRDGKIVFIRNLKSGAFYWWCYDVITRRWTKLGIEGLPKENHIQGIYSYVEALDRSI